MYIKWTRILPAYYVSVKMNFRRTWEIIEVKGTAGDSFGCCEDKQQHQHEL